MRQLPVWNRLPPCKENLMSAVFASLIHRLIEGKDLSRAEMASLIGDVMDGKCSEPQIAALLTSLRMKGEVVDEIAGAAEAMQQRATPIPTHRTGLLDTCGTGGDQLHTFNISTATAIVVAACGVPVAKHGNRSVSSSSGSADVLEALDVNLQLSPEQVARCIDEVGLGFCFAPLVHGAMKYAAPVRRALGFRTIFNLLGPLTNPARAEYQLLGVHSPKNADKLAHALGQLGRTHALVVCGNGELDEVSLWGTTEVYEITDHSVSRHTWTADDFGLPGCSVSELKVGSAAESADVLKRIFAGEPGPHRNIVVANAAAALYAAREAESLSEGVQRVTQVLDDGSAATLCTRLAEWTSGQPKP